MSTATKPEFDPLFGALMDDGWFPSPAHVMRRAAILDAFKRFPPGTILEMGCGAGRMLVDWYKLGHSGRAVDLDPTARHMAARCVETFHLPFAISDRPDLGAYDYLIATEVLEHVKDPVATLKEWLSYLRDDGIVLLTVPAFRDLWGKSDEWAGHVTRFEPEEFRRVVEDAGLSVQSVRLYGYPLGNLLRLVGNFTSTLKMRRRSSDFRPEEATFASGHDRSVEKRLAPLFRSPPGRLMLRIGIALQRYFDRGHGLVVIAAMPGCATSEAITWR